jgi:hypothetical protein
MNSIKMEIHYLLTKNEYYLKSNIKSVSLKQSMSSTQWNGILQFGIHTCQIHSLRCLFPHWSSCSFIADINLTLHQNHKLYS